MPYASCLVSCSVDWSFSACPDDVLCLIQLSLSSGTLLKGVLLVKGFLGFCNLFYLGYFSIALWDSLSGLVHSGIACLASQSSGYPLLGVHPSISIVTLTVIGYCCNCLDGQLNCHASAHWLISVTTMHRLYNWWLCHSTLLQWL